MTSSTGTTIQMKSFNASAASSTGYYTFLGNEMFEWTAFSEANQNRTVTIENYVPYLTTANSWLSAVESRIRDSVIPDNAEGLASSEWLNRDAASAAIALLQAGADMLPVEPHIYGTDNGDFVAEFEADSVNITSVVTGQKSILFGVRFESDGPPVEKIIRRGSNRLREEVRAFFLALNMGSHGALGTQA